jgi:hypothetical protein
MVGRGEKENKMVSNCKKLGDCSNILSPWEKARRYCKCVSVVTSIGSEMLIRQKNEQLNTHRNKVTTKVFLLECIAV